jgi:PAS domain S-box-containing protein
VSLAEERPEFGPYQLRFLIPGALLLASAAVALVIYLVATSLGDRQIVQRTLADAAVTASRLQGTLNYAAQHDEPDMMMLKMAEQGADPNVREAWVADENGLILASSRIEWVGQGRARRLSAERNADRQQIEAQCAAAVQRLEGDVRPGNDGSAIYAVYPVTLGIRQGESRPSRIGILFLEYDLSRAKAVHRRLVRFDVMVYGAFLCLLFLALGVGLHFMISKRVRRLAVAVERFGRTASASPVDVGGRDEIAMVAQGLNGMMEKIVEDMRFLNDVIENIPNMLFVKEAKGLTFVRFNRAGEELLGLRREDLYGKNDRDLFGPEVADAFTAADREVLEGRKGIDIPEEVIDTRANGRRILHTRKIPILDGQGNPRFLLGISEDITDIKRAERVREESESEWAAAMDASEDVVCLLDFEERIVRGNRAFLALAGRRGVPVPGGSFTGFLHPESAAADCPVCLAQAAKRDCVVVWESDDPRNALGRPVEITSRVVRDRRDRFVSTCVTVHDLSRERATQSDKEKLIAQLYQAQKMEAVGLLAGGIAHDFNNMLTAILGYATMLEARVESDPAARQFAEEIISSAEKSSSLTRQLLAFSRKQIIAPKPTDLRELLHGLEKLLRRLIGEDIELRTRFGNAVVPSMVDPGQIEQVLMNLATNARDAMPDGGTLTIELETVELDAASARIHGLQGPGAYGVISVSDSGCGMSAETVRKIFEPFYTTKESGKGTGLGLSIVYGIVRQHNGDVEVESAPGRGTVFRIRLPLLAPAEAPGRSAARGVPAFASGTETVLVGEDNPDVRAMLKLVLEQSGYTVVEAVDGEDAVARFAEHRDDVRLAILDVVMPGKNGREAGNEILAMKPGVGILYLSGYTSDIIHRKGILEEDLNFLPKPVPPDVLLERVRRTLDGTLQEGAPLN